MSTLEDDDVVTNGNSHGGVDILDELKQRRAALQQERSELFDIPGYGGKLVGKFEPVSVEELRAIGTKVEKLASKHNPRADLIGATDTLLKGCQYLLLKQPEHPKADPDTGLVALHDKVETDVPVGFDSRLVDILDLGECKNARQILWKCISNDYAVMVLHNKFMEWQGEADSEVDDDLVGEAQS